MHSSAGRIYRITCQLMRQNRWLLMLVVCWPFLLLGILLAAERGHPDPADVASILQQALYAGLVFVGLNAGVALGNEKKARRVAQVLSRAVSRSEYLAALWMSAFLPFLAYCAVWLLAGHLAMAEVQWGGLTAVDLGQMLLAEVGAGLLLSACGLLLSVVFPAALASAGTGLVLAAGLYAGTLPQASFAAIFRVLTGTHAKVGVSLAWATDISVLLGAAAAVCLEWQDIQER